MTFRMADLRMQAAWGQLDRRGQLELVAEVDRTHAELEKALEQVRALEAQIAERRAAAGGAR